MTRIFEENRNRLVRVATQLLNSLPEAEDAVQEAFVRLVRNQETEIENIPGWLTTVTSRICLDRLRARKRNSEAESIDDQSLSDLGTVSVEDRLVHKESLGLALRVVREALGPQERVAFVLHDLFEVGYEQISAILSCSPENSRQLASRARRKVLQGGPSQEVASPLELIEAFLKASREGQFHRLLEVLHPECELLPDELAAVLGTPRGLRGNQAVAEFFCGRAAAAKTAWVDGRWGAVWAPGGRVKVAFVMELRENRIVSIAPVADPERLATMMVEWNR